MRAVLGAARRHLPWVAAAAAAQLPLAWALTRGEGEKEYATAVAAIAPVVVDTGVPEAFEDAPPVQYALTPRNVARENLAAILAAQAEAAGDDAKPAAMPDSDAAIWYLLRALRPADPLYVCRGVDVDALINEASVVAITRGCSPAIAAGIHAALTAAAAADTQGFSWFIVSDSTPDAVADLVQQRLNVEVPRPYAEGRGVASRGHGRDAPRPAGAAADGVAPASADEEPVMPLIALFDRYTTRDAREKYFMPPPAAAAAAADDSAAAAVAEATAASTSALAAFVAPPRASTGEREAYRLLHEALVPAPATITAWLRDIAAGRVEPTMLGLPRPEGDRHPLFPFLTVVVSDSWRDVVLERSTDVALEAYMTDCPMCMALGARVRMAGYLASRFFPHVRVAVMNIDDNDRPKQWMPGPAFPTIQLFNAGRAVGGTGGPLATPFTKSRGPCCSHVPHAPAAGSSDAPAVLSSLEAAHAAYAAPFTAVPSTAAAAGASGDDDGTAYSSRPPRRAIGLAAAGSPVCVPSLDFSHPDKHDPAKRGRMALPSLTELVDWLGRYSSKPFSIDTLMVPASELAKGSLAARDMKERVAGGDVADAATAAAGDAGALVPLAVLCEDMEAEAKIIENAVFHLFWEMSVLDHYTKAFASDPVRSERAAQLKKRVDFARHVIIDRGFYGTVGDVEACLDVADEYIERFHMLKDVKAKFADEDEAAKVKEAIALAKSLLA